MLCGHVRRRGIAGENAAGNGTSPCSGTLPRPTAPRNRLRHTHRHAKASTHAGGQLYTRRQRGQRQMKRSLRVIEPAEQLGEEAAAGCSYTAKKGQLPFFGSPSVAILGAGYPLSFLSCLYFFFPAYLLSSGICSWLFASPKVFLFPVLRFLFFSSSS